MKLFTLLITFLAVISAYPQETKPMNETTKKLEEIKVRYIPDKRVAVFEYAVKEEGEKIIIAGETDLADLKKEVEQQFTGKNFSTQIELLPSQGLSGKFWGVVNLSAANLRTKPDHGAELATQGLLGQPVKVLKQRRGWYLVQTSDGYVSWADDDGIVLMSGKEIMEWKSSNKVIYTRAYGFAYSGKDVNSVPVSDLVQGDILRKISDDGEFISVEYPDKRTGFVPVSEAEDFDKWISGLKLSEDNIIAAAYKLMGVPYLWGGTSCKGVDCSGFTKTVFYMNGLILQRDASQQVHSGDEIDISKGFDNLQKGDLLFFGARGTDTTKERVTHVAIYLGNNDFIHSSGRVRINSLDKTKDNFSSYRFNSLLRAKRVIGAVNMSGITELKDLFKIYGMQQ